MYFIPRCFTFCASAISTNELVESTLLIHKTCMFWPQFLGFFRWTRAKFTFKAKRASLVFFSKCFFYIQKLNYPETALNETGHPQLILHFSQKHFLKNAYVEGKKWTLPYNKHRHATNNYMRYIITYAS